MKQKKSKKANQRIKWFLLGITPLILCCIILPLIEMANYLEKDSYKIDSRVENIKKAKAKDTENYTTIGWVRVQGTKIDTPVIGFHEENSTVPVELGDYVWNFDDSEKFYNKINIMGHNIMNLSSSPLIGKEYFTRFDDLMAFVYYDFAKDNQYIQYTVDGKDYLYKIFSVEFEQTYKLELYHNGTHTKKEIKELIKSYQERSFYKYDVDVNENDKLISLMTCTRFYGTKEYITFMVNARLIRKNEKVKNYPVEEKKEYKEIKKILKGADKNAEA